MNQHVSVIADPTGSGTQKFTADDFLAMLERGAFEDMRVELVDGVIEKMVPARYGHGEMNVTLGAKLWQAYQGTPFGVASDLIIQIDGATVRAGDVAVVKPGIGRDEGATRDKLLLVAEISHATVGRDLGAKRVDYARAGIPHYWVVELRARVVHVMRDPDGSDYRSVEVVRFDEPLQPPETDASFTLA